MPLETDYITPSDLDSESASEWCESKSDTDWEDLRPAVARKPKKSAQAPGRKSDLEVLPSIPTPSSMPDPSSVPASATSIPPHCQMPNDQDRYPDLPDYMPYMPQCVPQASPTSVLPAQVLHLTAEQMNSFMHQHCSTGVDMFQGLQGAGMGFQQGIKKEFQPGNSDLLVDSSDMGFSSWFDPSTGQLRHRYPPPTFEGNDFNFNFAAAMPFALSGSQLAMDPITFAPSGVQEPSGDTEHNFSKPKAGSNTSSNTIPLLCILCEKEPTFSDVSHLLTHISSKGHLSRRFHLDLQAQTDQEIKQRLVQFDSWFDQHGIQQLLKTRQETKDQKKRTLARRQRGIGNEKRSRNASGTRGALKSEPDDSLQLPASHLNPLNQQTWHAGMIFDNSYQTPSSKRTQSVYPEPNSPRDTSHHHDEPNEIVKQGGSGTPTLKGIIHKGMGMFDAATPEMKRVRNQRKHPSVLNKMVLVSESISMTEQVWNESMTKIEHERNVYDTPTDLSSPGSKDDDDDEPQPKRSRGTHSVPKAAGSTMERLTRSATRAVNGASTRASRGGKRGGGKRGGTQRGRGKKIPKVEEENLASVEDLDIHHGKRSLDVFHDVAANDGSLGGNVFRGRSQGAQGFVESSFAGQQVGFPPRNALQGLPTNRPLSAMYGRTNNHQFVMYDKENGRNAFSMQQSSNIPGFHQSRQSMQPGAFNPLYVQHQDNFATVYGQGFDAFKPSNSTFQSLNGMGYNGMHGGMNSSLNSDLHNGFNNDLTNGLNIGLSNNNLNNGTSHGSQFRSGNNGSRSNGFDIH